MSKVGLLLSIVWFFGCLPMMKLHAAELKNQARSPFSLPTSRPLPQGDIMLPSAHRLAPCNIHPSTGRNKLVIRDSSYELKGVVVKDGHSVAVIASSNQLLKTVRSGEWLVRGQLRVVTIGRYFIDLTVMNSTSNEAPLCSMNAIRLSLYPPNHSGEK
jgi:Tfp pilus assembly protein PilP